MDASFPSRLRLLSGHEFHKVREEGRALPSRYFTVSWLPNQLGVSRLGLIISKKVDKRAVVRNRLKRVAREIFRNSHKQFNEFVDLVVIARAQASDATNEDLRDSLLKALGKSGIL